MSSEVIHVFRRLSNILETRNVGVINNDADAIVGEVGNPVCGDMMTFYIKVKAAS